MGKTSDPNSHRVKRSMSLEGQTVSNGSIEKNYSESCHLSVRQTITFIYFLHDALCLAIASYIFETSATATILIERQNND